MFNYIPKRFFYRKKQIIFIENEHMYYRSLVRFVVEGFDIEHISRNVFP